MALKQGHMKRYPCGRLDFCIKVNDQVCSKTLKPKPDKYKVVNIGEANAWNMAKALTIFIRESRLQVQGSSHSCVLSRD
jgi:hypothetical protein